MSKEIPRDGRPIHYRWQYIRCSRKDICRTCRNGSGHGPYWYAEWQEGGKQVRAYCGKNDPRTKQAEKEVAMQQEEGGEPITELVVTSLLPEQVKVLEQYQMRVEPVWIEGLPYQKVFFPEGSVHRADPSEGPTIWTVFIPSGIQVHYYNGGKFYAVLKGNE